MVIAVFSIALALIIAFDLFVTIRLLRSDAYSSKQKIVQFFLVWVFPLLGAFMVLSVLNPPRDLEGNHPSDMSAARDDLRLVARSDDGTSAYSGSDASTPGDS